MTAAKTGGMRAIEAAIHHLVRSLLKATDHHEDYNLYTTEFNRLKSCGLHPTMGVAQFIADCSSSK
jgi:hypothetical protein